MNKLHSLIIGAVALFAAITFNGCASAHKKAETTHELKEWQIASDKNGKPHSFLVRDETWTDRYKGGGSALLADPKASQIVSAHTNQNALGGSSSLDVGDVQSNVSTNGIKAVGDAGGEMLGTIADKVLKK